MVVYFIDKMPITKAGKVDYKKLNEMDEVKDKKS